jgi:hypothetical protein
MGNAHVEMVRRTRNANAKRTSEWLWQWWQQWQL